ncbi:N-acetylmuramoyl-L-alanine amidase family protein [Aequorivita echinoideorum]|uniref:N-acetylmuramoyl-L-alanine amidase n=1 Tax=Aequorivita echinoideorum TaxID=1549647 RepID=A0ABS5S678_9FLAO|nr:N-acetylmuramoyl-L-alanine amidase [Aequorivita echinoideorum]MBT0608711.1 N-acetylmuramoyl-L-alanine amidase [Aequorivita echinoideorum]
MTTRFLTFFVLLLSATVFGFTVQTNSPTKPFVVVLDAGHGGKDPGNRGNGFYEKDIVLDVTLQVGKLLEAHKDIKVVYTRKTDVFIDLYRRGPIANEVDADIFVSIHCDSHNSQASGIGTFVMGVDKSGKNLETAKKENEVIFLEDNYQEKYAGFNPNSPESFIGFTLMVEEYLDQSIMLAGLIQNNIVNNLKRKDRSVRSAPFWVLHSSYMPSVLVELGFLTNNEEGPYVNSKKGRNEMAKEIANGILSYKKQISLATEDARNPVITEQEVEKVIEKTEENIFKGVIFKVQLAASGKKIDTKPNNFKGLKEISRLKEDGLFKYYYGETSDYNKITLMKTFAQQKGYDSAYVVAFKDGKKVNLPEVLKSKAD